MCLHAMNTVQSVCRINVGCGSSPTHGWLNLDGSPSVRLANRPWLTRLLDSLSALLPDACRLILGLNFIGRAATASTIGTLRYADTYHRAPSLSSIAQLRHGR